MVRWSKIPIISISINESLKKFINKLVSKNKYDNKSKLVRDALLRLMTAEEVEDAASYEISNNLVPVSKKILGNMIIVAPQENGVLKKLNKIETEFKQQIISKNQMYNPKSISIFLVFEGSIQELQEIVVEINSIKEIKNFRYLIIN